MSDSDNQFLILGSQRFFNPPTASHTWAVLHRASEPSLLTVSWLPKSLELKFNNTPEPGFNFSHDDTLNFVRKGKAKVKFWGPFQATDELFELWSKRIRQLNEGTLQYVMLDGDHRPTVATNCIHGCSDLVLTNELLDTGTLRGFGASQKVLEYLTSRGLVLNPTAPSPAMAKLIAGLKA